MSEDRESDERPLVDVSTLIGAVLAGGHATAIGEGDEMVPYDDELHLEKDGKRYRVVVHNFAAELDETAGDIELDGIGLGVEAIETERPYKAATDGAEACEECHGSGVVPNPMYMPTLGAGVVEPMETRCPKCNGTGRTGGASC